MNDPNTTTPAASPSQEILTRTRHIDEKTRSLMALLELLEEREGASPLEAIRETLIEILVEQKDATARLTRIENAMCGR
jgi:hypothetical protein